MVTTTNYSGGVQGGISNGMPIVLRVAYKVCVYRERERERERETETEREREGGERE
jgi:chorismate synthase